jgi:hypothetical protein
VDDDPDEATPTKSHHLLTYDSDGFEHEVLTSTDEHTADLMKTILKTAIRVRHSFHSLSDVS